MANIGRQYKRLFERDFGPRFGAVFQYLPERFRLAPFPGLASNCIRFTDTMEPSAVGEADYHDGKVTYLCQPADAITPGAFARLVWSLTNDANFARYDTYWGIGTEDWYRTWGTVPITTFPFLSNFPFFEWIKSPEPTCVPGRVGWSPWLWSYGPPE